MSPQEYQPAQETNKVAIAWGKICFQTRSSKGFMSGIAFYVLAWF